VFADALPDAVFAYNADDPIVVELVAGATGCVAVPCSGSTIPDGGNGVRYGALVINGVSHPAAHIDETYRFDLVVAGTLAAALGATTEAIGDVVASFIPGPHRREMVASIAGVTFINDSKATNPHAALAAVAAYPSVILLAGGRNKGLDLTELANAAPLKALVAFGEARREIAELAHRDVVEAETLSDAFAAAIAIATDGDTVLLAPGCASFDEFGSYEERGRAFRELVEARRSAA
jgi:UDP-N-acetylmuramoylalanine-D-glutamate ligase